MTKKQIDRAIKLPRKEGKEWPLEHAPVVYAGAYDKQYHTELGLHSNIPKCCVDNYVNKGPSVPAGGPDKQGKPFGYGPCPKCNASGKSKPIHICAGDCPGAVDIARRANKRHLARGGKADIVPLYEIHNGKKTTYIFPGGIIKMKFK